MKDCGVRPRFVKHSCGEGPQVLPNLLGLSDPPIKGHITARVLAAKVHTYQRGNKSVHCSDNSKGDTDCNVTPSVPGNILVAGPGYVSSAYINLQLPDHRIVGLSCNPGFAVWSNRFCSAPKDGEFVRVVFKGRHATVEWDLKYQKILSVDKIETRVEHRSEKYEISSIQ